MHERSSAMQSNASQIAAQALKVAADALARWLGHPIASDDHNSLPVSLAVPNEMMCCCRMPVDVSIGTHQTPPEIALRMRTAGHLLLAWRAEEAAWLVDQSLHQRGTSTDPSTWGTLERSAIAETSNVVGCEFLNAVAEGVRNVSGTDVQLIPHPPQVDQQLAGQWMDDAIIDVESGNQENQKAWLATGSFQVANHAIHTRFAMVWCPEVWQSLTRLVGDSSIGDSSNGDSSNGDSSNQEDSS